MTGCCAGAGTEECAYTSTAGPQLVGVKDVRGRVFMVREGGGVRVELVVPTAVAANT